jgi:hypothetical protein
MLHGFGSYRPLREKDDRLPNVRGSNMLLLLNIFEDDQHDHSLSVDHLPPMGGHLACHMRSRRPRTVRSTVSGCQRNLLDYCRRHPNQTNVSTNN